MHGLPGYNNGAGVAMIRFPSGALRAPPNPDASTPMFSCSVRRSLAVLVIASATGCNSNDAPVVDVAAEAAKASPAPVVIQAAANDSAARARVPNEVGRIPVLEYHLIGDPDGR